MTSYGIEKIHCYPTSLRLDFDALAQARGVDAGYLHRELMVDHRGLNPGWEDVVTMAVNAARPMLSEEDLASVGLLIVATETGLDMEKSVSSWVLGHLGLPDDCRHFEVKSACYAGTAALRMAQAWLASGLARAGRKALVITSDESLPSLHKPWEFVLGAGAVAMLVSGTPDILEIELDKSGIYAHDVTDVIRPLPWLETGNSELSLVSYLEALVASYEQYARAAGPLDFQTYFRFNAYHLPFGGIGYRAHKQLMTLYTSATKAEIQADFQRRVRPSMHYTRRMGSAYAGGIFLALLGIMSAAEDLREGDRIGIYSYGSGSCAEFYSGRVGARAQAEARACGLEEQLESRFQVPVETYERLEEERSRSRRDGGFTPDFEAVPGLYEARYRGRGLLVYRGSKDHVRHYEDS